MGETVVSRLKTSLMQSNLQQTNQPLFQVISQLIDSLSNVSNVVGGAIQSGGFDKGSVIFADIDGNLSQDNSNFYYDVANKRLAIGTNAFVATEVLHVQGTIRSDQGSSGISFIGVSGGSNLHIVHDATSTVGFYNDAGGGYSFKDGGNNTKLFIADNGSIHAGKELELIHTTNPFIRFNKTDATAQLWDINGGDNFQITDATGGGYAALTVRPAATAGPIWEIDSPNGYVGVSFTANHIGSGAFIRLTGTSASTADIELAGNFIKVTGFGNTPLYVDTQNNRVGIEGITSPSAGLDVNASARFRWITNDVLATDGSGNIIPGGGATDTYNWLDGDGVTTRSLDVLFGLVTGFS